MKSFSSSQMSEDLQLVRLAVTILGQIYDMMRVRKRRCPTASTKRLGSVAGFGSIIGGAHNHVATRHKCLCRDLASVHRACPPEVAGPGTRCMDSVRAVAAGELCSQHSRLLQALADRLHPSEPCAVYEPRSGYSILATHAGQCPGTCPPASRGVYLCRLLRHIKCGGEVHLPSWPIAMSASWMPCNASRLSGSSTPLPSPFPCISSLTGFRVWYPA